MPSIRFNHCNRYDMTFGISSRSFLTTKSTWRCAVACALTLTSLGQLGCQQDYNPSWDYADTPSTLPLEEEITLVDNGEIALEQLDLDGLSDIGEATKSLSQLNQERQAEQKANQFTPDPIPAEPWIDAKRLPLENWESYYLKNKAVGYIRRDFQKSPVGESDRLLIKSNSEIHHGTSSDAPLSTANMMVVESRRGEFRSIKGTIVFGSSNTSVSAVVTLDTLTITTVRDGKTTERKIPLDPNLRGPFAAEESLLLSPMKQGEVRKLLTFDPSVSDVVQVELIGRGNSRVPMASGEFLNLFEIEQRATYGNDTFITTFWTDETGQIKKRYLGAAGMTSNQVSKETGAAILDIAKLKGLAKKTVSLPAPIELKSDATKISFRALSRRGDPFNYFSSTSWQLIHSVSPMIVDVDVTRLNAREALMQQPLQNMPVEEVYLADSHYIDFKQQSVSQLADQWLKAEGDAPAAIKIAEGVHKLLELGHFDCGLDTASEVAHTKKSDCLGAATLMCAAARSAKIPARIAYGLTYEQHENGPHMQFHAWPEVYHGDKWLPLDCTRDDLQLPLTTLKVTDSPLDGQNAVTPILKVFEAIQALELSVRAN